MPHLSGGYGVTMKHFMSIEVHYLKSRLETWSIFDSNHLTDARMGLASMAGIVSQVLQHLGHSSWVTKRLAFNLASEEMNFRKSSLNTPRLPMLYPNIVQG
jgi:hypothetical protein